MRGRGRGTGTTVWAHERGTDIRHGIIHWWSGRLRGKRILKLRDNTTQHTWWMVVRMKSVHFVLYKAWVLKNSSFGQVLKPWHLHHINETGGWWLECKVCISCCTKHGSLRIAV